MELKYQNKHRKSLHRTGFNRTFMELKFDYITGVIPRAQF